MQRLPSDPSDHRWRTSETEAGKGGGSFLANGLQGPRVEAERPEEVGATCLVRTCPVTVRPRSWGFDTISATPVSSSVPPPCSAIFLLLPE